MENGADSDDIRGDELSETENDSSSVIDDVISLVEDGRTYAEAELAFQKTRMRLAGRHAKWAAIFGGLAAFLVLLAIFALVFGAILALTPLFTAWGATALVVATLAVVAMLFGLFAKARINSMMEIFGDTDRE